MTDTNTGNTSLWQTEEVAKAFLQGVREAVPGNELQFAVIGKIVRHWRDGPANILDLGCGDGVVGRALWEVFPGARCVFADFSEPMLVAVREKVSHLPQASVVKADFATPGWVDAVATHGPFDVVVSGFAIHHQPDDRKRSLYREIHELLAPGGVFLNLEHVASHTPAGEALFHEFFVDSLYAFHARSNPDASREVVNSTYYERLDKRENILAPVETQCDWLRGIGFQDVDCFFKLFEIALFGGRK
uniref:Ubiquinone/menaquinone biosynthesis C-methylase UbiE n=1 Tax=Candidatus Kentrum sp. DK TaxID=2126562 RepID=A0A450RYD2_9GAMM|nr:MAG: Ubiquinone/menaquinone biosynthesis C-methylase UbiE [Candidatus Kentron sp. DK]